jgi:hypothetical protein
MPRRRVTPLDHDADNLRAELGREPLRLATLAARTWGLAGPSERDVTNRLQKRIGRELGLRFGTLEGMAPDELHRARTWCTELEAELRAGRTPQWLT